VVIPAALTISPTFGASPIKLSITNAELAVKAPLTRAEDRTTLPAPFLYPLTITGADLVE
jgi:hypothetical protein